MQQMEDKAKCKHIECPETNSLHSGYCLTHYRGGIFALAAQSLPTLSFS